MTFYYTTMQKLCNFDALYRPEIQCKCHKGPFIKDVINQGTGERDLPKDDLI